jgi:thiamine kinase-like enzyme
MSKRLFDLIEKNLLWDISDVTIEYQEDGMTNQSYIISKNDIKYVVRICGSNSSVLGIDRNAEYAAMNAAASIGVGAELVYYSTETGNMITKLIKGKKWKNEDTSTSVNIARIADTIKRIHLLPPIPYTFSPYKDIEDRIEYAKQNSLILPDYIDKLIVRIHKIKENRDTNVSNCIGLCHNDPFPNNFIDDGSVRLIDWEFGGMGDIYFDLASIGMFYSTDMKADFLKHYFGHYDDKQLEALIQMTFVVMFWNAMWAVLQSKLSASSQDYETMASNIFIGMRELLE